MWNYTGNVKIAQFQNLASIYYLEIFYRLCPENMRKFDGIRTGLYYIKSALSVYIISSLHLRKSKVNKAIQYILISNNT